MDDCKSTQGQCVIKQNVDHLGKCRYVKVASSDTASDAVPQSPRPTSRRRRRRLWSADGDIRGTSRRCPSGWTDATDATAITRTDRKSQVRQCLGFCSADSLAKEAQKSCVQKTQCYLTWTLRTKNHLNKKTQPLPNLNLLSALAITFSRRFKKSCSLLGWVAAARPVTDMGALESRLLCNSETLKEIPRSRTQESYLRGRVRIQFWTCNPCSDNYREICQEVESHHRLNKSLKSMTWNWERFRKLGRNSSSQIEVRYPKPLLGWLFLTPHEEFLVSLSFEQLKEWVNLCSTRMAVICLGEEKCGFWTQYFWDSMQCPYFRSAAYS